MSKKWAAAIIAICCVSFSEVAIAEDYWYRCTRNKKTQLRVMIMGNQWVNLGSSAPFRAVPGAKLNPIVELAPGHDEEIGDCFLDEKTRRKLDID